MFENILFVCTGNSCRSPMAEVMFKKILKDGFPEQVFRVHSAGTVAYDGAVPTGEAKEVMKRRGLDLSQHTSRRVNGKLLEAAEIVFVMAKHHREEIEERWHNISSKKIHLLREYAGFPDKNKPAEKQYDIDDPIGAPVEVYEECAGILQECLNRIAGIWKRVTAETRRNHKNAE